MRFFVSAVAILLSAAPAAAFEYSRTGEGGYLIHVRGNCADKACTHGTIRAREDCDIKKDPQNCTPTGVGDFVQTRPGCFHVKIGWIAGDGQKYEREGFRTANGGMCEGAG